MMLKPGEEAYKIVRFYRQSRRRKIIYRNVSRAFAMAHCSNPETSRAGVWFDGFERQ